MALDPELLKILVCPLGRKELKLKDETSLVCACGVRYRVEDGIPIMLIDEAELPAGIGLFKDLPCQPDAEGGPAKSA